MNQKEYVKLSILSTKNEDGTINVKAAVEKVAQGLMAKECPYEGKIDVSSEKGARTYAGSVVKNYLKKDTDLNGGQKYVPENPKGPRVKDQKLKDLVEAKKSLEVHGADSVQVKAVDEAILARKEELKAEKGAKDVMPLEAAMEAMKKYGLIKEESAQA